MRLLHTMLRVGDMDKSIVFYTEVLGMTLLRRKDYPEGQFTLAFVGYGNEAENSVIELTYNWGVDKYELGTGYGHIALEVEDVYKACEDIRARGGKITREPGPMKHGSSILPSWKTRTATRSSCCRPSARTEPPAGAVTPFAVKRNTRVCRFRPARTPAQGCRRA